MHALHRLGRTLLAAVALAPTEAAHAQQQPQPLVKPPLGEQVIAGIQSGGKGAAIGGLLGLGVAVVSYRDKPGASLEALVPFIGGAFIGYVLTAPTGVRRVARAHGWHADPGASYVGAVVGGFIGLLAGGIPFIVTVPLGAAMAHNGAASPQAPPSSPRRVGPIE